MRPPLPPSPLRSSWPLPLVLVWLLGALVVVWEMGIVRPPLSSSSSSSLAATVAGAGLPSSSSSGGGPNWNARLLVLVIANHHPSYRMNWAVWRRLQREHADVQVYMVVSDPTLPEGTPVAVDEADHLVRVRAEENFIPGILAKTVKAMAAMVGDPRRRFTQVLRTNMSSVWHWGRLLALLEALRDQGDYAAGYFNYNEPTHAPYVLSGAGILLTRAIARLVVDRAGELRYDLIDDVAIAVLLERYKVHRLRLDRCDYTADALPSPLAANQSCYHYRVKNNDRTHFDWYILPRLYFELYDPMLLPSSSSAPSLPPPPTTT